MKVYFISDTHGLANYLHIPEGIDMIIHGGDESNSRDWMKNEIELDIFLHWFANLPIKHKVMIAGNHSTALNKKYNVDKVRDMDIIYGEHEYVDIEGKTFFLSPYTPTFGNWSFMKDRSKLDKYWDHLVPGIDVLVTHGPPKGIMDLTEDLYGKLEMVGDKALFNHVVRAKPKYHLFGHLHSMKGIVNYGTRTIPQTPTIFMNGSMVEDGRFDKGLVNPGHIFEI